MTIQQPAPLILPRLRYYETGSTYAPYNLAIEEALTEFMGKAENAGHPGSFLLWQNSPAVIIGRHQNAQSEVHLSELEKRGINLVRRLTGGGAVYHDLGNLNFSFLLNRNTKQEYQAAILLSPLLHYLASLGIPAGMEGRNDLTIQGAGKFSGLAGRRLPNLYQLHGTLLFEVDLDILEQVLQVDPEKYTSKGVSSVKARVTNLRPLLTISLQEFWQGIKHAYQLEYSSLPLEVTARAQQLAAEKYSTRAWNIGQAPAADITLKKRFPFGKLELRLRVKKGQISRAIISGDFLTATSGHHLVSIKALEDALIGLPSDAPASWASAWRQFDLEQIFYGQPDMDAIAYWLASAL